MPLLSASLPETSGLFAIQLFDSHRAGQRFRPIYFGETESFTSAAFPLQHEAYGQWIREAKHAGLLFISVFRTPLWNECCRKNTAAKLHAQCRVPRGVTMIPPAEAPPQLGQMMGA